MIFGWLREMFNQLKTIPNIIIKQIFLILFFIILNAKHCNFLDFFEISFFFYMIPNTLKIISDNNKILFVIICLTFIINY